MSPAVVGIVPARSGSKGVPGKNTRLLHGRPLLEYTARAAFAAGVLDRVILTTDSPDIADVGRRVGLEVPFLAPCRPVAGRHADGAGPASCGGGACRRRLETPGIIVLLQPTSPLRRPEHIVDAVEMLKQTPATSVVSVVEVPRHLSPDYVMRVEAGVLKPFLADGLRITRRQDARQAYVRDGTVYAFRAETLDRFGDIYGNDCRPLRFSRRIVVDRLACGLGRRRADAGGRQMRSAIRRMVPQAFRHRVSAELARFRSAALRRRFAALAAEGWPILAGPWLGEVGFEVLYWAPFLRWFAEEFHVDPARIIVISRGGTASWYQPFAGSNLRGAAMREGARPAGRAPCWRGGLESRLEIRQSTCASWARLRRQVAFSLPS